MKNETVKFVLIEIGLFALQIIFSAINLFEFLSPVVVPFAFARAMFGGNIFLVAIEFFVSKAIFATSINMLYVAFYETVILVLFKLFLNWFKGTKKFTITLLFLILSSALELYFSMFSAEQMINFSINLAVKILLIGYFYLFIKIFKQKFLFYRFSHRDYLLFSIICFLIGLGFFSLSFKFKAVEIFILLFALIVFSKILPIEKFFIMSGVFQISLALIHFNSTLLIIATIMSVVFVEVKNLKKQIELLIVLTACVALVFIFKIYNAYELGAFALSIVLGVAIPNKTYFKFGKLFEVNTNKLMDIELAEKQSVKLENKLMLLSNVFRDMQNNFKMLMVGKIDRAQASAALAEDLISKTCADCENYRQCFFGIIDKRELFSLLLKKAITSGHVDLADIPAGLDSYCTKHSIIVSETNQIAYQFKNYESAMKTEDESKLIISSELQNFSDIFLDLAGKVHSGVKQNEFIANEIHERLLNALVDAKEVSVLEKNKNIESIRILAPSEQLTKHEIAQTIYKTVRKHMKPEAICHTAISGLSIITFVPNSKFRIEISVSTKAVLANNGDNVCVKKLENNRFFVALADGMGHGEKANKISKMVLSLVQGLFEAGVDDRLVISSVNKLLLPAGLDNFSTLDACVIDLDAGEITFIKLGSSFSVFKHVETSELISCESLPIGVVKNVKPTIVKKTFQSGDLVLLASDGVVDSFESVNSYKTFINDFHVKTVKGFLDETVCEAESRNHAHSDDMTIVGINLLKNY
ncbi:MAG: SpoIIE family protein phosphatase [Clostridia bacterium]|nr:SpoIIE family protein phosphatase [Clostridia bacterium]